MCHLLHLLLLDAPPLLPPSPGIVRLMTELSILFVQEHCLLMDVQHPSREEEETHYIEWKTTVSNLNIHSRAFISPEIYATLCGLGAPITLALLSTPISSDTTNFICTSI